jgi:hypothetical protein
MLTEGTTSIASTPVNIEFVAPVRGLIVRGFANAFGTTTGTITVAVTVNGGSDIFNSTLTIPAGSGSANNPGVELARVGAGSTTGVMVNEGDSILATPSGGSGSNIGGAVTLVILKA